MFLAPSPPESLPGLVGQAGYHHLTHRETEAGSEVKHRILVLLLVLSLTSGGTSHEPWPLSWPQSLSSQSQGSREEAQKRAGRLLCLPRVTEKERETGRQREGDRDRKRGRERGRAKRETERGIERGRERDVGGTRKWERRGKQCQHGGPEGEGRSDGNDKPGQGGRRIRRQVTRSWGGQTESRVEGRVRLSRSEGGLGRQSGAGGTRGYWLRG